MLAPHVENAQRIRSSASSGSVRKAGAAPGPVPNPSPSPNTNRDASFVGNDYFNACLTHRMVAINRMSSHSSEPPRGRAPWFLRALRAWATRGWPYLWHKATRKVPDRYTNVKRILTYTDPRLYWTHRGGADYFQEQEGQPSRTLRSEWLATALAGYRPQSVLEVGCGYGKQLLALRRALGPEVPLVGVDFSPTQLAYAYTYLRRHGCANFRLIQAQGDALPFADHTFDLVFTSAVILHNPPAIAERIRREVVRVSARWTAHNEDTDLTYNRYGYDTAAWYRSRGYRVCEAGPIPVLSESERGITQFTVAEVPSPDDPREPGFETDPSPTLVPRALTSPWAATGMERGDVERHTYVGNAN